MYVFKFAAGITKIVPKYFLWINLLIINRMEIIYNQECCPVIGISLKLIWLIELSMD